MPKIAITRRSPGSFTPPNQDDVPEGERLVLHYKPMSLALEERFLARSADQDGVSGNAVASLVNEVVRSCLTHMDNGIEWEGSISDEDIQAIPLGVRLDFMSEVLSQAGLKSEVQVGESE